MAKGWPRIILWKGASTRWYFHKKSANGEITMDSQGYKEKRYAKVAIKREYPNLPVVELSPEEANVGRRP
jgi:uncharacterized protein YegP (UPF0339 family)